MAGSLLALAACSSSSASESRIAQVAKSCGDRLVVDAPDLLAAVGDGGDTITMDTRGDEDSDGMSLDGVACVLGGLGATEFVVSQIDNTRALDGQQRASWDRFEAVWSFHPDTGLALAIHDKG